MPWVGLQRDGKVQGGDCQSWCPGNRRLPVLEMRKSRDVHKARVGEGLRYDQVAGLKGVAETGT